LNDPRLGSRVNVGQPANTGQVISGSTYRDGAGLPGFVAGAVNDLNSGASGRAAMQAEWLSRLANQMGASGDNAYLWAEVLRGAGGINSGPGNTTTGGGGGLSFGAGITPGGVAREQANLLAQQAQDVAARSWAAQNAVGAWNVSKAQEELNALTRSSAGAGWSPGPAGYGAALVAKQAEYDNALRQQAIQVSIANRGALGARVMQAPNTISSNGLLNGTGYAVGQPPGTMNPSGGVSGWY
jgi:hypothetical protein